MASSLENRLQKYPRSYITDKELETLMDGTSDSRYGKVKRLLAQGKLLRIRRGLYYITEELGHLVKPHLYELAQYIYAPSYVSLESALSFHQLIPEAVYTTTGACTKRSKQFNTPLGTFTYSHLPLNSFYTEVELVRYDHYQFFMAKPWKAICDYVYSYKKEWNGIEPLIESLRIDYEDLPTLHDKEVKILKKYYHHSRMDRFLKGIQKDLCLTKKE